MASNSSEVVVKVSRESDPQNSVGKGADHQPSKKLANSTRDGLGGGSTRDRDWKAKGKSSGPPPVSYSQLYRFASWFDIAMMVVAVIAALLAGSVMPIYAILLGNILNGINDEASFNEAVDTAALRMLLLGIGVFVCTYIYYTLPMYSSTRQISKLRLAYMKALLRQDAGWYDTNNPAEVSSRMAETTQAVQDGISEKFTVAVSALGTLIAGLIVAFTRSWKLSLVLMAFMPITGVTGGIMRRFLMTRALKTQDAYAKAGSIVAEVVALIRSVAAFGGESAEVARYDAHLGAAMTNGIKASLGLGFALGVMLCNMFISYAVGLYYGSVLILENRNDHPDCYLNPTASYCFAGGDVLQVIFAMVFGAMSIGMIAPEISAVFQATGAAAKLFQVIDRVPGIDVYSPAGLQPDPATVQGKIEFRNVSFSYPSRPDQPVLTDFNLVIEAGQSIAVCGPSGSGKSTLSMLIMRFYDPTRGQVLLDGIDLREYNVQWLRAEIGIVQQLPQLFAISIRENIALGRLTGPPVSMEAVISAAKAANVHDFIGTLEQGYETMVTGAQLSGGQMQRVTIARAIIRNPKILLLDEATSALDSVSERVVQAALDRLLYDGSTRNTRTALTIAHRLSTITQADKIIVLEHGKIVEEGTHTTLLAKNGVYKTMYDLQRLDDTTEEGAEKPDDGPASDPTVEAALKKPDDAIRQASSTQEIKRRVTKPVPPPTASPVSIIAREIKDAEKEKRQAIQNDYMKLPPVSMRRLWKYQAPDWPFVILAVVGSCIQGAIFPANAIVMSHITSAFYLADTELHQQAIFYMGIFFLLAGVAFVAGWGRLWAYGFLGERLTRRLRADAFRSIIRNEIGWFDMPENAPGRLGARLSQDAAMIRGMLGERLGLTMQMIASLIAAIVIAFIASWRITLLLLAVSPILVMSGAVEGWTMKQLTANLQKAFEECAHIATEAIVGSRTVAAFGLQAHMNQQFEAALGKNTAAGIRRSTVGGIGQAATQFLMLAVYSLNFWAGAQFINNGWMTFQQLLQSFFAISMSAQNIGRAATFAADRGKAEAAIRSVFSLIDRHSAIDPFSDVGDTADTIKGKIEFKDIRFTYPARPNQEVLHGLTFDVQPGTTVALVGPSGCGKSSVVALLERFYDPSEGAILLDGRDLRQYNVRWLRQQQGWVQQQAPLFGDSCAYNIKYGARDTKPAPDQGMPRDAKEDMLVPKGFTVSPEAIDAAKSANAHGFISSFRHGYATNVGERGNQLSGGQCQRVAIARAIIRHPDILILDEATSALDSESERIVTETIESLITHGGPGGKRRTTVVIAHRLSTIRHADKIVVIEEGKVVETGTHDELLLHDDGAYQKLALAQDPLALTRLRAGNQGASQRFLNGHHP